MSAFENKLSVLVAQELNAAHNQPERLGILIERLIYSLALVVAMGARGDAREIERLLHGAEAYLYESAAEHAKLARLMASERPLPSMPGRRDDPA